MRGLTTRFGLTTLRNQHVQVERSRIRLPISRKERKAALRRPHRPADARTCSSAGSKELPGQELFEYVGPSGEAHPVSSDDVNAYLREISGDGRHREGFPDLGRDGSRVSCAAPHGSAGDRGRGETECRRGRGGRCREVPRYTPAVCRASYVHPDVVAAYALGSTEAGGPFIRARTPGARGDRPADRGSLHCFDCSDRARRPSLARFTRWAVWPP